MPSQHYKNIFDLIRALQLYIKRSYTTLYPEKIEINTRAIIGEPQWESHQLWLLINLYTRQEKYTNNNNRQRE